MCELFAVRAAEPFSLAEVWPLARAMERFGLAGWGWGAAWIETGGGLAAYRDPRAFRDDPAAERIGRTETTAALVHLRRPSRLSTRTLADTQPFCDPAGRFAFVHNGDFASYQAARRIYAAAGRIAGRADSEVGMRWLEDHWDGAGSAARTLADLHVALRGQANLATLAADGNATVYAANRENPIFTFRLGRLSVAATGLYSLDRSFFRLAAPEARRRGVVHPGSALELAAPQLD